MLNSEEEALIDAPNQVEWLKADLESNQDATWKFVVFHVPPFTAGGNYYSTGRLELKELLVPIFQQYNVDMVFSGHDHNYERSFPIGSKTDNNAITYIVCGNGGTPLRYVSPREWTLYCERVFGFTMINIDGSRLHLQSISIDDKVIDEFRLDKSDPGSMAAYLKNKINYENIKDAPRKAAKAYRDGRKAENEMAIELFAEAYRLDTSCVVALGEWSVCLADMGRYDEAQQWADRLHEVTPDDPGAYSLKAEIYSEQGQMKNAIEAMLKAIDILPNGASLHFDLADLYAETGDTANALVYYASGVDWYMDEEFDEVYLEAEAFIKLHLP